MGGILSSQTGLLASTEGKVSISFLGTTVYTVLVLGIIFGSLALAKKGITGTVFRNPLTQLTEQLYLFIENMCVGIIGAHGRKYIPFIITLWIVIFVGNMTAIFFGFSPTASLSFNLGMALICIGYVQYEGIAANGFLGHLSHFSGPKLGGLMALLISPLIFAIELVSELMKNASLSLRLYGNIFGGGEAVHAMNELGKGVYLPLGEFLMLIKFLTVVVQAMIFCVLTCVYFSLVTHHAEEHGDEPHS